MTRSSLCPFLLPLLPLLLCATGAGQAPTGAEPLSPPANLAWPRSPIHTAPTDDGLAYGLWAAGRDYKVSFHDGMQFVPYLGKGHPVTRSLGWRTQSVRVGELELWNPTTVAFAHSDYRATFTSNGVVEAYDVRDAGVEQTFVIEARPAAAGDLVVRGALHTNLWPDATVGAHGEVVFRDEASTPIVSYGAATAIDAAGRRKALTTTIDGGALSLRLDANWLAQATFPLVVDPLLAVFFITSGADLEDVDIARDDALATGNIWHATQRWASASDADVLMLRADDDGQNPIWNYEDITTSWSSMEPSLGMHYASGSGLLAFVREFPTTDTRRLRFHKHSRNDNLLQTHYGIIDSGSNNAHRPDVATDLGQISTASLVVVFQREGTGTWANVTTSDIYGCTVSLAGLGSAGVPFAIAEQVFEDNERPSIGKLQLGGPQQWTVAWQVVGNSAAFSSHVDWDVMVCRVDRNGNVGPASEIVDDPAHCQMAPHVTGFHERQFVAFTRSPVASVGTRPSSPAGEDLVTSLVDWSSGAYVDGGGAASNVAVDARMVIGGVDVDRNTGDHYLVSYRSTVTQTIFYRVYGFTGNLLRFGSTYVASAAESTTAGAVAFDEGAGAFLIAYGVESVANSETQVRRYTHPSVPAPTTVGVGCGSGQLSWIGSQLIGSADSGLRLLNVPAGALMVVLAATAPASLQLFGVPPIVDGCWLLVPPSGPDYLGMFPPAIGPTATWTLPLPEALSSLTLHLQGVHFDAANAWLYTTSRLTVPLVK